MKPENDERSRAEDLPYRAIVENSLDAIALIRRDASVLYASPAIARVIGYPPAEFQGRNVFEFIHPDDVERSRTFFAKMLQEPGASITAEVRCRHRDGSWRVIEVIGVNRFDDPEVGALIANYRDVTDRNLAEQALHSSEARQAAMIDVALDAIVMMDGGGNILEFNASAERIFGHSRQSALGRPMVDLIIPPALRERHRRGMERYLATGETTILGKHFETTGMRADGSEFPVELTVTRVPSGGLPIFTAYLRDISDRWRAETALRESEERFRVAAQISTDLIYEWDLVTGSVLFLHESEETRPDEVPRSRHAWEKMLHPEDRDRVLAAVRRTLETDQPFFEEYRVVLSTGAVRVRVGYGKVLRDIHGRPLKWIGVNTDLTDKRHMEAALRENEERLRTLVDNVPVVLFAFDNDGIFTHSEGRGLQALGWKPGQAVGRSVADLYARHADAVDFAARALRGESFTGTVRLGASIFDLRFAPSVDRNGNRTGVIGVATDVTEHRRAEQALRSSETRYRQLFERNLAGLYRSTPDGKILDCNETFARMYGYESCDEILAVDARGLYFSAKEREAFLGKLEDEGALVNYELRGRRKDGSAFWLLENVTLDRGGDPWVIGGTMLDITDRKEAEEGLKKSRGALRKLSLRLGSAREEERSRIAREIHDELGQRLTVLKMAVARLRRALPRDPEALQSSARGILTSIDELMRTVRDLSTELRPAVLDHLELVEALEWQARDFESRTGIPCRVVSRVDRVTVEPGTKTDLYRVTQEALTNVVRHAGASRVQIQISRKAGNLLLEIADNGQGIAEEDLIRPDSLGLLGIRERIQALGGTVRLINAPAGGMKLRVRIPLARETE